MEELSLILREAIKEKLPEDHWDQANELVDAVCNSFDAGGDASAINDAIAKHVNILLETAESTLINAEKILRGGA